MSWLLTATKRRLILHTNQFIIKFNSNWNMVKSVLCKQNEKKLENSCLFISSSITNKNYFVFCEEDKTSIKSFLISTIKKWDKEVMKRYCYCCVLYIQKMWLIIKNDWIPRINHFWNCLLCYCLIADRSVFTNCFCTHIRMCLVCSSIAAIGDCTQRHSKRVSFSARRSHRAKSY